MRVQFVGKLDANTLMQKLAEIARSTAERAMLENEGMVMTEFEVHDAEFTVKYKVEGIDEPQILTVEHHEGYPEMFKWIVNADNDDASNNKEESEFDAYTVAKAQGKEMEFKEIESDYNILDLQENVQMSEDYGTMSKKVYDHKDGYKVVQVRQHKRLIQEYKLIPKEEQVS